MELKLEQEDVKQIILNWAEKEMPGKFNTVEFLSSFSREMKLVWEGKLLDKE